MRRRRGYTLLEIAVVLVILAALGGVALPALAALRAPSALDAAVSALRSAAQRASLNAVTSGAPSELVVDAASGRAWLHPGDSTFALAIPAACRLNGATRARVRFDPDGRADGALPDIACGTARARVAIDPLTGALEVQR